MDRQGDLFNDQLILWPNGLPTQPAAPSAEQEAPAAPESHYSFRYWQQHYTGGSTNEVKRAELVENIGEDQVQRLEHEATAYCTTTRQFGNVLATATRIDN